MAHRLCGRTRALVQASSHFVVGAPRANSHLMKGTLFVVDAFEQAVGTIDQPPVFSTFYQHSLCPHPTSRILDSRQGTKDSKKIKMVYYPLSVEVSIPPGLLRTSLDREVSGCSSTHWLVSKLDISATGDSVSSASASV